VIGAISRFVQWKGVQHIIPAFQKILEQYPTAKLVLANAQGDYEETVKKCCIHFLPILTSKLNFEDDLAALYQLFDVFVHVPIEPRAEAFGQTYVESLISRIPSVFTLSE